MGPGDPAGLQGTGERLSVNAIGFTPMLTNPHLPAARGVYQNDFISPLDQQVVHEPSLPASLDRNLRCRLVRSEQRLQRFEFANRRALYDLSLGQLAIAGLPYP